MTTRFVDALPFTLSGTAEPNTTITVTLDDKSATARTDAAGHWTLVWTTALETGTYTVRAGSTTQLLRVQLPERLPRQPGLEREPPEYGTLAVPNPDAAEAMTDRWRIAPPPYELDEHSRGRLDPYNRNILKGDYPVHGNDIFFVLTGISDTLAESRTLPTPSGVSAARPASFPFFGDGNQNFFAQSVIVSGDLYEGNTTFQPVRRRIKATLIANFNRLRVRELGIVKPSPRRGNRRNDGHVSLQELFYEQRLRTLTPQFDFLSVRAGAQPFSSDFRGFVFSDTNLGIRAFGNYAANRYQYNLAFFERLEKDTNSGLNTLNELRGQRVAVANFYWQDFLVHGYTQQFSVHYLRDDGGTHFDRNGVLARPSPVGSFQPHRIDAVYLGQAGLGHLGRINVDHALYYVLGRDTMNPIAGPDPELRAPDSV
ncbi:MAG TPA: hypothetical protein VF698_07905, partial [Thermoanaerobaculia bacterium]